MHDIHRCHHNSDFIMQEIGKTCFHIIPYPFERKCDTRQNPTYERFFRIHLIDGSHIKTEQKPQYQKIK